MCTHKVIATIIIIEFSDAILNLLIIHRKIKLFKGWVQNLF